MKNDRPGCLPAFFLAPKMKYSSLLRNPLGGRQEELALILSLNDQQPAQTHVVDNNSVRKIVSDGFKTDSPVVLVSFDVDSGGDRLAQCPSSLSDR